ncbi:LysM peptidoglycan-binding domain-containing protein [Chitinophaga sp. SYP-B3965]|uniref:CIS tube protein n=1 Tax=Chitinophaga sp. SYP-B3965 TaxID=2663120 RepID=UPI0012997F63|nr:LysM peptidoglycan-binding domain-containing protein [Chitinophaga sp. SYP-B3965]MRG48169.1 LysM peptidoglycan-binding domain-containing protein [Chitinophaga sp. SYP-B3965]
MFDEGTLAKMRIIPCIDASYTEEPGADPFIVQVNPDTYTLAHSIVYNDAAAQGNSKAQLQFNRITPQQLDFDFLFDGTGVISQGGGLLKIASLFGGGEEMVVADEIEKLKQVVLNYSGDIHEPRYVKLSWGALLFKCRLTSLRVQYKLFKPDGTPLRAVAKCSFRESVEPTRREAEEGNNSPDLTHVRVVKEGDTLPLMTYRIYGDSKYYLEVAKANGLVNFRDLKAGQQIFFPPIAK